MPILNKNGLFECSEFSDMGESSSNYCDVMYILHRLFLGGSLFTIVFGIPAKMNKRCALKFMIFKIYQMSIRMASAFRTDLFLYA